MIISEKLDLTVLSIKSTNQAFKIVLVDLKCMSRTTLCITALHLDRAMGRGIYVIEQDLLKKNLLFVFYIFLEGCISLLAIHISFNFHVLICCFTTCLYFVFPDHKPNPAVQLLTHCLNHCPC